MDDPELDAMSKCTEVLKDLDNEAKVRILEYLVKRFKLAPVQQQSFNNMPMNSRINHLQNRCLGMRWMILLHDQRFQKLILL